MGRHGVTRWETLEVRMAKARLLQPWMGLTEISESGSETMILM